MIVIIVEHFLNQAGKDIFSDWILSTSEVLQSYEGFLSLQRIEDIENPHKTMLELRFQNLELLRIWSRSQDHEAAINSLKPFREKKQESRLYRYV